jgi:hypothetical protein
MYTLAVARDMHETVTWFDYVGGVLLALVILAILIEAILMIPDFIRTVKIHMM